MRSLVGWALLGLGLWQAAAGLAYLGGDGGRRWPRSRQALWTLPERERLERIDPQLAAILELVESETPEQATVWCVGPSEAEHFARIGALQILLWPRWFFSVDALPAALPRFAADRETYLLAEPPLPDAWRRAGTRAGSAQGQRLWRLEAGEQR